MSGRRRRTRSRRAELSQHFLSDAAASRLVQATSIRASDLVIEIGPGRGALTKWLLQRTDRLIGVELDAFLANRLAAEYRGRADIRSGDFLEFSLPEEPYLIVGNLPYAQTTDMLRRFTETNTPPEEAWLVIQQDSAERFCGRPFQRESLWSLRLKPFWDLEIRDWLRRQDFSPPPAVDSVLLHLNRRQKPLIGVSQRRDYLKLLEDAFKHRDLRSALRPYLSKGHQKTLARRLRFHLEDPPAALCFEQWLALYRFTSQPGHSSSTAARRNTQPSKLERKG
ncbi:MAG: rRNA adenine dimethyltransferase family protein [Pseudomonadota bacterium]